MSLRFNLQTLLLWVSAFLLFLGELVAREVGVLSHVEGKVHLIRSLKKIAAKNGDIVLPKDVLITGKGSRVEVNFWDDNDVSLDENSRLKITGEESEKHNWLDMDLEFGHMRAKLKSLERHDSFVVKTPVAVAGVRGTDFTLEYREGQEHPYQLDVLDGHVDVHHENESFEKFKLTSQRRVKIAKNFKREHSGMSKHRLALLKKRHAFRKVKKHVRRRQELRKKFKEFRELMERHPRPNFKKRQRISKRFREKFKNATWKERLEIIKKLKEERRKRR